MRDGRPSHRNVEHLALCLVLALRYRGRDRIGLTQANPDASFAVANDDESAEVEASTALDDLGYPTNLDDPILEVGAPVSVASTTATAISTATPAGSAALATGPTTLAAGSTALTAGSTALTAGPAALATGTSWSSAATATSSSQNSLSS